ncbi:MAG: NADH-quinone oxidoreductase subunit N [Chthonomonadales bacterium]
MLTSAHMAADMAAIKPALILCTAGCVVLLGDAFVWRRQKTVSALVALAGAFWALAVLAHRIPFSEGGTAFSGALAKDSLAGAGAVALCVTALLAVLLAWTYLPNRSLNYGEYYALLLFSVCGGILMASAQDLIVLFLGLEVLSFTLYVLAGFERTSERSDEAALKYFLLGAFASAFFLYGVALLYGATGSTNLAVIGAAAATGTRSPMILGGIGLILVGMGFKAGVVPFHQWTPDVYEGAPTSATAYMAAGAKIGAFTALVRIMAALVPLWSAWLPPVQILAILTMVFGNLLAMQQRNVKRLLAYSSVAHAGYLLVAVAAMAHKGQSVAGVTAFDMATSGIVFYLFAYLFMTLGAFGVLIYLSARDLDCQTLEDLRGLVRREPLAAYAMLFFMLSLGGIPPTMGFFGKWMIFLAALKAGELGLAIVLALASALAVYYYLKVVWVIAFEEPKRAAPSPGAARLGAVATLIVSAAATVIFGLFPFILTPITDVLR